MDRVLQYPGAVPLETDILNTNKFALAGLAKLAKTVLGTGPWLVDFTCVPTSPAGLNVQVTPGQIYNMGPLDATAYSSVAADSHQVLKQGILWDAMTLACPAPTTSGYSINYLIEIGYFDVDTNSAVLPYYNSASPNTPYSGPNNTGAAQNTVRQGQCSVQVKAGIGATTGTQATPSPDSGYLGAYVVTVASGQTTITASNISAYPGAPLVTSGQVSSGITLAQAQAALAPRVDLIAVSGNGLLTANTYLGAYVQGRQGYTLTVAGNLSGAAATATSAASTGQTITLYKMAAGSTSLTAVGTVTYASGSSVGTFATTGGSPITLEWGDTLLFGVGSTADTTLANVSITLPGTF